MHLTIHPDAYPTLATEGPHRQWPWGYVDLRSAHEEAAVRVFVKPESVRRAREFATAILAVCDAVEAGSAEAEDAIEYARRRA